MFSLGYTSNKLSTDVHNGLLGRMGFKGSPEKASLNAVSGNLVYGTRFLLKLSKVVSAVGLVTVKVRLYLVFTCKPHTYHYKSAVSEISLKCSLGCAE